MNQVKLELTKVDLNDSKKRRHQRGNQNPQIEGQTTQWPKDEGQTTQWPKDEGQTTQWSKDEGQTTQWPKEKGQNNNLQNTAEN
jgi:hypothetical protein